MQTHATFIRVSELTEIQLLRTEYLDQLEHAQEASLEVLVPGSDYFVICVDEVRCGYFIVHGEDTLIEFYLWAPYWVYAQGIFEQLLAETPVKRALVKSFDHLLFSSCIAKHTALRVTGLLVRDLVLRDLPERGDFKFSWRVAAERDLPAILAIDQQVFRHPERLNAVIRAGYMQLFESEGALIGFGITRPIIPGRKHVELGIAVDKPWRLKGYSMYIFRSIIDNCLAQGLMPVAGLSPDNLASRSMGERAGMISRHRLLEISF